MTGLASYDADLARAVDRHTAGPTWEGMAVDLHVSRDEWRGHHQVLLTLEVEAGSAEGWVTEAETEQGVVDFATVPAKERWLELTSGECETAEFDAAEAERSEREYFEEQRGEAL